MQGDRPDDKLLNMSGTEMRSSTSSGPLGKPSRWTLRRRGLIGGGVGAAIAYPTAKAMKEAGNHVISIVETRTRS